MFYGRDHRAALEADVLEEDANFLADTDKDEERTGENIMQSGPASADSGTDGLIQLQPTKPYLLFTKAGMPPQHKAAAICHRDRLRDTVHGHKLSKNEGAFNVLKVLDANVKGPDDEPLLPGTFLSWDLNMSTDSLGSTVEMVEQRSSGFLTYLDGRGEQNTLYQKQVKNRQCLKEGDHVLLPIPRVDRSNTCPKNLEAKVIGVLHDKKVQLGTDAGKVSTPFLQEQLDKVTALKRKISVGQTHITLTKAYRSETSYGISMCKCTTSCGSKRCKCTKSGF